VSVAEKSRLREDTQADAVEMESGVIRQLCRNRHLPAATLRAISDAANEDLPLDFNQLLTARQAMHWGRFLLALARKPASIPGLLRLQRHCAIAAQALASVIVQVARDPALSQ
jgi:adenosylhomocysteine nucleosidase